MKNIFLITALLISFSCQANTTVTATSNQAGTLDAPKLHFDNQGNLVLVISGKLTCVYHYDKNGNSIPSANSGSCGAPQNWLKTN
jgi:hypothetical protein